MRAWIACLAAGLLCSACSGGGVDPPAAPPAAPPVPTPAPPSPPLPPSPTTIDPPAGVADAGIPDARGLDAGGLDAGVPDAGVPDAGMLDSGIPDAGIPDAGVADAGIPDAGVADAGIPDAGVPDAGVPVPAPRPVVANISYTDIPGDLIVNGSFESYPDPNVPDGWTVDEIYAYRGMYTRTDGWLGRGVQFVRNAQGRHLLAQTVQVAPNHRYTAQMVYQVTATDSRHGGLYVLDAVDGTVIGKADINRPTNGWRIASLTFDSGERTQVKLEIGYLSGMNGTAIYDAVSMFEDDQALHYAYKRTYRDVMHIAPAPVDELVPTLADYVTRLLASPQVDRLAHRDAYAAELPYYLFSFLAAPDDTGSRSAWCQRTALALAELLAMYGVPTRQIHVSPLQHEFIEYYDGATWVVFDPYFGIRYVLADHRLGVDAILRAGLSQVSLEVPTREHVFLIDLGYLMQIWGASNTLRLGIDM